MRSASREEHIFVDQADAFSYSVDLHSVFVRHVNRATDVSTLWPCLVELMEAVPVYHHMEFSVSNSEITLIMWLKTRFGQEETSMWVDISHLLCESANKHHLVYNPAEGF